MGPRNGGEVEGGSTKKNADHWEIDQHKKKETFRIHNERWTLEEVPKRHRLTIRRKEK